MLASTNERVTSRLKKNSPRLAHIFYGLNHYQILTSRLKKISSRVTYIFLTYTQQFVLAICGSGITKKIYTSYVFLLKANIADIISTIGNHTIKKVVVVGGIFS